uniref:Uncharacterized protein n=1 Tax=Panagrolaimus superbus TaxID=310955 RepID=A0A914YSA2_9BILA
MTQSNILWLSSAAEQQCKDTKLNLTRLDAMKAARHLIMDNIIQMPNKSATDLKIADEDVKPFIHITGCYDNFSPWFCKVGVFTNEHFDVIVSKFNFIKSDANFWGVVLKHYEHSPSGVIEIIEAVDKILDADEKTALKLRIKQLAKEPKYYMKELACWNEALNEVQNVDAAVGVNLRGFEIEAEEFSKIFVDFMEVSSTFKNRKRYLHKLSREEMLRRVNNELTNYMLTLGNKANDDVDGADNGKLKDCKVTNLKSVKCLRHDGFEPYLQLHAELVESGRQSIANLLLFVARKASKCTRGYDKLDDDTYLDENGNFKVSMLPMDAIPADHNKSPEPQIPDNTEEPEKSDDSDDSEKSSDSDDDSDVENPYMEETQLVKDLRKSTRKGEKRIARKRKSNDNKNGPPPKRR